MYKIRKIKFKNHPILNDLELDFCNSNGEVVDTIILAGENGTGKSTILNELYNIATHNVKKNLEVEFEDGEGIFTLNYDLKEFIPSGRNILYVSDSRRKNVPGLAMHTTKNIYDFNAIFSDVNINFRTNDLKNVTSLDLDDISDDQYRSSNNMATEINQLLIDIQALDDADINKAVKESKDEDKVSLIKAIPQRMDRFTNAFNQMFENLTYSHIENSKGKKNIVFKKCGNKVNIEGLSTGEKQIVYRGCFLLRNTNAMKGAFVFIDEPEISLHPNWQMKIMDFYKNIFKNEKNRQTSQIFVATHSPFIIHNENRVNDKVIVLEQNKDGKIIVKDRPEYYKVGSLEAIQDAFNLNKYIDKIKNTQNKTMIVTEGKTDIKHLKNAFKKLKITDLDIDFMEICGAWGDIRTATLLDNIKLLKNSNKIIGIFDRDNDKSESKLKGLFSKEYMNLGNNVYAFAIPKVEEYGDKVSIEHYYKKENLLKESAEGRRLFLGSEFSGSSGISKNGRYFTKIKERENKCNINGIIDEKVYKIEDIDAQKSIALSKDDFADLVMNNQEFSKDFDYSNFQMIFDVIREIIKEN